MNQAHKFFSALVRDVHVSRLELSSLARERKRRLSCACEKERESARNGCDGLSFSSASGRACSRRGPFGIQNMCGKATLRPPPSSSTPPAYVPPSFPNHLRVASCPEMTNVTCHGHKGKLSSTTRHGNRVASPAMLSQSEKKRAEGLFLRREHAQDLCWLSPTDALAASPRWWRRRHRRRRRHDNERC